MKKVKIPQVHDTLCQLYDTDTGEVLMAHEHAEELRRHLSDDKPIALLLSKQYHSEYQY